jgi:hypothetical protein
MQERFEAHDRRFRIIRETGHGSVTRMMDWARAYLRRERVADARHRRYEAPQVTAVGNMFDLLARVDHGDDPQ